MRRILVLALAIGLVPALAGCDLLGVPAFDEEGFGEPLATYATGSASLVIDGETIVLDQLSRGPHLYDGFGADVYWFNDDGWGLRLTSYDAGLMGVGDITIDRVRTTYWSASGYDDCILELDLVDETGVRGSATCDGLRWVDQLRGGGWSGGPPYVDGEPAFDATVEFSAAPALPSASGAMPSASPG